MRREDGYTEPPWDPDETEPLILLQYQPTFHLTKDQSPDTFPEWESAFDEYRSWVSNGLRDKTLEFSPLKMYSIILSSYLRKSLTKPKDILKAFTGIMTELEPRMGSFWYGLPRCHLLEALTWQYDEIPPLPGEFSNSGKRFHPIKQRNIRLFPSWSWCGLEHCPGASISLTSCAFEETRRTAGWTSIDPRMISIYIRDQNRVFIRLNRSDSKSTKFLESELNKADENQTHSALASLIVPLESLLIFKTFILRIDVGKHPFHEKGGWAMFPIANGENKLKLRHGSLTMVHLEVKWRKSIWEKTRSDELDFAVLGIFPQAEFGSMRVIAFVVSKREGVHYRAGLAEFNTCIDPKVPYDECVEMIATNGTQQLMILG
jgi:hypothetical protein